MTYRIKKARTCEGCRALIMIQGEPAKCQLGFMEKSTSSSVFSTIKPNSGGCPKPITYSELIYWSGMK